MPTTAEAPMTAGNGDRHIAGYAITEDTLSKFLQRLVLSDSAGAEKGTAANPIVVATIPQAVTAVTDGKVTLAAATAADIFAAGAATGKTFRNRGPNDMTYVVGGVATGAASERTLGVGEEKTLPYRTGLEVSGYSLLGTDVEVEAYS